MKEKTNANRFTNGVFSQKNIRKQLLIIVTILFTMPFAAQSQMYFYYPSNYIFHDYYDYSEFDVMSVRYINPFNNYKPYKDPGNLYKINNIKSLKVSFQDIKKDKTPYLSFENNYNENGLVTLDKRYNRKGKYISHIEREFDKSVMTVFKSFNRKGKINTWHQTKLNSKGNVLETNSLDKDGNIFLKRAFTYNDKGKTIENCSYKGKKQKLFYRVAYSYYPNGELESTATYNGKGKLQKFWSYACSSKGQETKNMKDTVKVCKVSDYDKDGGFTITNISTGEDGQLSKTVTKYDKDTILIESSSYDSKNRFVSKRTTTKVSEGWLCQDIYFFTKKQTPRIVRTYTYNENKKIVQSSITNYNKREKIRRKAVYDYNEQEYNNKISYYKKGGESIYKILEYTRNENGMPVLVTSKDKLGNIAFKTIYQYQ